MADANGTLIKMQGVKKVFFTDEVENPRARGDTSRDQERNVHLDCRAFWLRQVDAAVHSWTARLSDRWHL